MSVDKDIYDAFRSTGSVRETAKEIGCSWNRVVKSLASVRYTGRTRVKMQRE